MKAVWKKKKDMHIQKCQGTLYITSLQSWALTLAFADLQSTEYSENNNPVTVGESAVDLSRTVKVLAQEQWVRVIIN